jgi:hypothetical protein
MIITSKPDLMGCYMLLPFTVSTVYTTLAMLPSDMLARLDFIAESSLTMIRHSDSIRGIK